MQLKSLEQCCANRVVNMVLWKGKNVANTVPAQM